MVGEEKRKVTNNHLLVTFLYFTPAASRLPRGATGGRPPFSHIFSLFWPKYVQKRLFYTYSTVLMKWARAKKGAPSGRLFYRMTIRSMRRGMEARIS